MSQKLESVPPLNWYQLSRIWLCSCLQKMIRRPSLGALGERVAATFLRLHGYRIVVIGASDGGGEIDIIALDGQTIVFVEVKTRQSVDWVDATDAVNDQKQVQINNAAQRFLKRHQLLDYRSRFDVIAILWPPPHKLPAIRHYRGAF